MEERKLVSPFFGRLKLCWLPGPSSSSFAKVAKSVRGKLFKRCKFIKFILRNVVNFPQWKKSFFASLSFVWPETGKPGWNYDNMVMMDCTMNYLGWRDARIWSWKYMNFLPRAACGIPRCFLAISPVVVLLLFNSFTFICLTINMSWWS